MKPILLSVSLGLCLAGTLPAEIFTYGLIVDDIGLGPLTGETGTGSFSYDSALSQVDGIFSYVNPSNGLLSFSLTINSVTFDISNAVANTFMPTVVLNTGTQAAIGLRGIWGSTGASGTAGDLYRIYTALPGNGDADGFHFHTNAFGAQAFGSGWSVGVGFSFTTGSAFSDGRTSWTLESAVEPVPEPATAWLALAGLGAIAAVRRRFV